MNTHLEHANGSATAAELGVGMRLSVHPHCDDFQEIILGALDDVTDKGLAKGLTVETDDVSTYVAAEAEPAEEQLAAFAAGIIAAASRRSNDSHVVAHVLLSRGCPGEVSCDLNVTGLPIPGPVRLKPTGIRAVAQWSLYPLLDGGSDHSDHMAHIEAAIAGAHTRGTVLRANHYATKLGGDVAEVLATAVDAWAQVGTKVPHVVTHLTVSVNSPSPSTD